MVHLVGSFSYDPFGQAETRQGGYPFYFTGRVPITPNLYYHRARLYNAAVGRFISEDLLASRNLYSYAGNSPVDARDPFGLFTIQLGYSFNGQVGPVGSTASIGIAVDLSGNVGFYSTVGLGGADGPASYSSGPSAMFTNAPSIVNLRGGFLNISGTAGGGFGGTLDYAQGTNPDGTSIVGLGGTIGPAAGASTAVIITDTQLVSPAQLADLLLTMLSHQTGPNCP